MPTDKPDSLLLVDDTPANLTLLSQILRYKGYQLRAVTSGGRALASVDLNPPDLVLLDIRMPEMDGYEMCRRLKANPKTADIPVIFISALDDIEDKVRAFAAGGVDYVTKPFQVLEDATWERATIELGPGDALLLYTDRVTEAANGEGEFFGTARLTETACRTPATSAEGLKGAVLAAVQGFTGDAPLPDDIALLVLARDA